MEMKFQPFYSSIDGGFWESLADEKLNRLQLDESPQPIRMYYPQYHHQHQQCFLHVGPSAFTHRVSSLPPNTCLAAGHLINFNTLNGFKSADKSELLRQYVRDNLWPAVIDGLAVEEPYRLVCALLLTFTDLKHYRHYYWFAFPAVLWPVEQPTPAIEWANKCPVTSVLPAECRRELALKYRQMMHTNPEQAGFFVVEWSASPAAEVRLSPLKCLFDRADVDWADTLLAFVDPCANNQDCLGWPVRNLLALLYVRMPPAVQQKTFRLLAFRPRNGSESIDDSWVFDIRFRPPQNAAWPLPPPVPECVGWERDPHGRLLPRFVNLGSSMDPHRLAEASADLNLKLMKWRQAPQLDLDVISSKRYLLIGAGTLGCYMARCLMGWGVRQITFVDNGAVSHSNIVRQPLFEFADFKQPKAEVAARALKRIFPAMRAEGLQIEIPMPGHPCMDAEEELQSTVNRLDQLFREHDVIFLGTDTRESRWLPTVLGNVHGKMVINAALGFDTFLIMRHGVPSGDISLISEKREKREIQAAGSRLGCYFCNDIVPPTDSTRNRTLDQECTVTRPGLAPLAAATAVELAVSLLQHPDGVKAPVDKPDDYQQQLSSRPLSCLPHQLRHFLSTFNTLQITGQHFPNCTACSKAILDEYAQRGWQFVRDVCLDSSLLSRISGLDQILKRRGGGGDGNRQTPGLHASDNGEEEEEWDWADSESGSSASD